MNGEFLRLVESIHKDKGIDRDLLFAAVEQGIASAAKKRLGGLEVRVTIDRDTGKIHATNDEGEPVDVSDLGRIAARTAYQVMTQRIREAESGVVFDEFQSKIGTIVAGTVQRFERGDMIVTLDRTEAVLPRREQVDIESYRVGDHIRAYLLDIDRQRSKVRVILSRAREEFVEELFKMEVPEIQEGAVVVKALVREPGHRTKVAVESTDPRVDPVGACVGVRGSRIRSIVDELHGEHIDIVPYSPDIREFLMNSLQQVRVVSIDIDEGENKVSLLVDKEDLSRAIGRRGQNIRLTSRLVGMEVDVSAAENEEDSKEGGGEGSPPQDQPQAGPDNEAGTKEEPAETARLSSSPGPAADVPSDDRNTSVENADAPEEPGGVAESEQGVAGTVKTTSDAPDEDSAGTQNASDSLDTGEEETPDEQGTG